MKISVDCLKETGKLKHFWKSVGFTPANLLFDPAMQQTLTYVGSIPHQGIIFVRIHYLLDLVKCKNLETERPEYDFLDLDRALDILVENGLKPFFELMGNPSGFFSDFCNNGQLHAWRRLIRDLALHLIERYGEEEVREWYFESWNEPDIKGWWHQWPENEEAFCNYYDACSEGLREADEKLRLGGPATCKTLSSLFKTFLNHCDRGVNYFTGEKGVRLDFISIHEKGAPRNVEYLNPDTKGLCEREIKIIQYVRKNHPRLANIPIINDECDPQVGWWDIHTWHALPYYAALVCKVINQHRRKIIEEMKCDYMLSNDNCFLGTWGQRTLLVRFGDQENLKRGEFELVKKPIFNALVMLSLLGDVCLSVEGCEETFADIGVIATKWRNDQIAVLIYNSSDKILSSGLEKIELCIKNIPFKELTVVHYRIDEEHGNPFKTWENIGAPEKPTSTQLDLLRENQELVMIEPPQEVTINGDELTLTFDLPLPAVSLILINKKPEKAPEKIEGLHAKKYKGLTDRENILISWKGSRSRFIKTYEVLYTESLDAPFKRINENNIICSSFLHTRKTKSGRGYYKVRAVDYWGRYSEESEMLIV